MASLLSFKLVLIEWLPLTLFVSKFDGRSSWRHEFTAFLKVVSSENDYVTCIFYIIMILIGVSYLT